MSSLDLRFLLSINSENAWSDLLVTMMEADPVTTRVALGLAADVSIELRREVSRSRGYRRSDRPDVVVTSRGHTVAVIEAKLLAGLGDQQLERYYQYVDEGDREACTFLVVSLRRLRLDSGHASEWANTTWEELLSRFAESPVAWVSETARAWADHIDRKVPEVDGATIWNDVGDVDIYLALRLRSGYLYDQVTVPEGSSKSLSEIGSGGLYVAVVDAPIVGSGYVVRWEATEALPTQDVGRLKGGSGLRGVDIRFFLVQQGVSTSRGYNWDHLARLWRDYLQNEDWISWNKGVPRKRVQWESEGIQRLRSLGCPTFVGAGYGEGQAKLSGEVELGARFVLPPTVSLDEAAQALSRVAGLGARMAELPME